MPGREELSKIRIDVRNVEIEILSFLELEPISHGFEMKFKHGWNVLDSLDHDRSCSSHHSHDPFSRVPVWRGDYVSDVYHSKEE
jgi:hypothetical protein